MSDKIKQYINIAGLALLVILFAVFCVIEKREKEIVQQNLVNLTADYDSVRTKANQLALEKSVIQVNYNDLSENVLPQMQKEIDNLRVKLRKAQVYSQTVIELRDTVFCNTTDTVIVVGDNVIKAIKFDYSDKFATISGVTNDTGITINYSMTDTIVQVVYKGKRQKWWKIFTPRPLMQRITCKNPHAHIVYNELVIINV